MQVKKIKIIKVSREGRKKLAERDYLQVFVLTAKFDSKRGILQHIEHKQEAPYRHWEHEYPSFRPVCGKLFAIDDGSGNGTLLWADEY